MLAGSYVWYPQTSKNVALAINNRMKSLIQKKQLTNSLNSTRDVVEGKFNSASKAFKKSTDEVKSRVNKVQKDAKKEINKAQKEVKGKVDKAQKQIKKEVEKTQKELKNKIEKAKK